MRTERLKKIIRKINKIMTTAAVIAPAVCFLSSCSSDTVYFSYQTVDDERWDKADNVSFEIVPSRQSGKCNGFVVLRMNDKYPYKNLSVNVETAMKGMPCRHRRVDFDVTRNYQGIRHNDYIMPLDTFTLSEGDTLRIRIAHDMKRHVLRGITNVGVKIEKIR